MTGLDGGTPAKPNVARRPHRAWGASKYDAVVRWDYVGVALVANERGGASWRREGRRRKLGAAAAAVDGEGGDSEMQNGSAGVTGERGG